MSIERIERTSLWLKTLAPKENDNFKNEREELRASFWKLRSNVSYLVSKIAADFPGMTQHDISHLDALWEIASLIAGKEYELNPLEGFILGGAILLHDSALCYEAYKNGIDGVRSTVEWKDSFAALNEEKLSDSDEEIKKQADFLAIRSLHARQAELLASFELRDPSTGDFIFLLENTILRKHFGRLIGEIASSHHWDIETLEKKLPNQENSISPFPREWRVDPIKIACLLRCADAAHLDNERAPDFLHALIKRRGLSFVHWVAQNQLASVDLDQSDHDKKTLLFTSTINFTEEQAEAWWIVFDAINIVDKEIKSSNLLLEKRNPLASFQVKQVKGTESPETLSRYIKVSGWKPHAVEVHVSNIERLVKTLGGEMLYGATADTLEIVIRELIQNARDSIIARKSLHRDFEGKIILKVIESTEGQWLIVEDDGVGMTDRVLTGSLLDFGTSFWSSDLVQSEFPGLRSSNFKPIGKFGIGFYSIFMIAKKVSVTTKPLGAANSDISCLKFNNGFSLRPILTKGFVEGFGYSTSTQVKLKLRSNVLSSNLMTQVKTNIMGAENFEVPFKDYISAICCGLDTSVYFSKDEEPTIQIHKNIEEKFDKEDWLNVISFSRYQKSNDVKDYISKNSDRLRPISEHDKILGYAAISTQLTDRQNFLNLHTIGGLSNSLHNRDSRYFIGYIDFIPKSAKRDAQFYAASESTLFSWATDQLKDLLKLSLSPFEKCAAASSLCHFKVDPTPIANILLSINNNQLFHSFEEMANLSKMMGIAFLESTMLTDHMEFHHKIRNLNGYALVLPVSLGPFNNIKLNEQNIPEKNYSMIDCLHRSIIKTGLVPNWTRIPNIGVSDLGMPINALIVTGQE